MENYWKTRKKAKKLYETFKPVKCVAVDNQLITFPTSGFYHLIFKGRKTRSRKEQICKMKHLKQAYEIISKSSMHQEYDVRQAKYIIREKGLKKEVTTETQYWGLVAITGGKRIKVILKKSGTGNYQFWSVMPNWKVGIKDGSKVRKLFKGNLISD